VGRVGIELINPMFDPDLLTGRRAWLRVQAGTTDAQQLRLHRQRKFPFLSLDLCDTLLSAQS